MSTSTLTVIELDDDERDAIAWHADSEATTVGEEMMHLEEGLEALEHLIDRAQFNASIWRAAVLGRLTPTEEIAWWLQAMRTQLLAVIRDDRRYLERDPGESDGQHEQFVIAGRKMLDRDLDMLAACERLIERTGL